MSDRRLASISLTVYELLLHLYPEAFRRKYGREMLLVFRDQCRDAKRKSGVWGIVQVWMRSLLDIVVNACGERLAMPDPSGRNHLLVLASGDVALILSWIFLLWAVLLATLFLDPWETAIWARPVGTLAGTISRFFGRTPGIFIPATVVLLLQLRYLFVRWQVSNRGRLVWTYALTNVAAALALIGSTLGAMRLTRLVLPQFFLESSDVGYGRTFLSIAVFILVLTGLFALQSRLAPPERDQPEVVV